MAYGIEIRASNGTKLIIDPTFKPTNLITCKISGVEATSVTLAASATSASITAPGVTSTNAADVFILVFYDGGIQTSEQFTIARSAGSFTLTNTATVTRKLYFLVGRYV